MTDVSISGGNQKRRGESPFFFRFPYLLLPACPQRTSNFDPSHDLVADLPCKHTFFLTTSLAIFFKKYTNLRISGKCISQRSFDPAMSVSVHFFLPRQVCVLRGGGKEKEGAASFLGTCLIFASPASSLSLSRSRGDAVVVILFFTPPSCQGEKNFPPRPLTVVGGGKQKGSETQYSPHMLGKENQKIRRFFL